MVKANYTWYSYCRTMNISGSISEESRAVAPNYPNIDETPERPRTFPSNHQVLDAPIDDKVVMQCL